mmetsp:Transcript_30900/g.99691  ORF Transcript_30900/g.99691 Transcript_30900/m.99691 type:complete len:96 (+) Transcript_30900:1097-1384(+)
MLPNNNTFKPSQHDPRPSNWNELERIGTNERPDIYLPKRAAGTWMMSLPPLSISLVVRPTYLPTYLPSFLPSGGALSFPPSSAGSILLRPAMTLL